MADTVTMFPLSPAQLGMWYAQLLDPGVPLSEAQYIEMRGRLDLDQLRRAGVTAAREFGSGVLRLLEIDGGARGVTVTHAGLAGLAAAVADSYQVMPDARVLQCLNPSFDASIPEWLME